MTRLRRKAPRLVTSRTYNELREVKHHAAVTQERYEEAYEVKCVWDDIRQACLKTDGLQLIDTCYWEQVDKMCIDEFHHAILKLLEDRDSEMKEVLKAHDCYKDVGAAAEALVANIDDTTISAANELISQRRQLWPLEEMFQDLVKMILTLPELGEKPMAYIEDLHEDKIPELLRQIEKLEERLEWTFSSEKHIGDFMDGIFSMAKNRLLYAVSVVEKRVQEKEKKLDKYEELFSDPEYDALVEDLMRLLQEDESNVSLFKMSRK
ncbi:hypothetical protein MRX96_030950 [Rhipicephalus microplus]